MQKLAATQACGHSLQLFVPSCSAYQGTQRITSANTASMLSALCLLPQVQALAQSTIQDLHSKLAARSAEIEGGGQRLEAAHRQAAAEVGGLQDQLEQLTHQLQLQDQRHIKANNLHLYLMVKGLVYKANL